MTEHAVGIDGGGPTWLMLEGEVAMAGGSDDAIVAPGAQPGTRRLRARAV